MTYKTVLAHVSTRERSGKALDAAIAIAAAHNAHLTGLHVAQTLDTVALAMAAPYGEVGLPEEVLTRDREEAEKAEKAAHALFEETVKRAGLSVDWRSEQGDYADFVAMHARYADLVVIGERGSEAEDAAVDRYLPEDVVLSAGRPVLVVPASAPAGPPKKILVAWNASREATRAAADALPLLEKAESVTVLAVNPRQGTGGHGDIPSADIALYLARHGVTAEAQAVNEEDEEIGDVILARAADAGADLIVSGAYGHSRLREYVLGGVTRTLLNRSPVPVLLSH